VSCAGLATKYSYDALGGMAVPELRDASWFLLPGKNLARGGGNFSRILTNDLVCAFGDSDRALGVSP
jgi:hypothetical protein